MVQDNSEYKCLNCNSNFVELLGQGIENFTSVGHVYGRGPEASSDHSDNDEDDGDNVDNEDNINGETEINNFSTINNNDPNGALQRIVSRLFNINVDNNDIMNSIPQVAVNTGNNPTPIAVVIRPNGVSGNEIENNGNRRDQLTNPIDLITSLINRGLLPSALPMTSDPNSILRFGVIAPGGGGGGGGGVLERGEFLANEGRSFEDLLHHLLMSEPSHGHQAATPEDILSLNRKLIEIDSNEIPLGDCGITLEPFEVGETAIILPCSHAYKDAAILELFKQHNTCPVCRLKIGKANN